MPDPITTQLAADCLWECADCHWTGDLTLALIHQNYGGHRVRMRAVPTAPVLTSSASQTQTAETPPSLALGKTREAERASRASAPIETQTEPPALEPFLSQAEKIIKGMAGVFDDYATQEPDSLDDYIAEIAQALAQAYANGKADAALRSSVAPAEKEPT